MVPVNSTQAEDRWGCRQKEKLREIVNGDLEQLAAKPGCTSKTTWEVCKADLLAQTTETDSAGLEEGPGN